MTFRGVTSIVGAAVFGAPAGFFAVTAGAFPLMIKILALVIFVTAGLAALPVIAWVVVRAARRRLRAWNFVERVYHGRR